MFDYNQMLIDLRLVQEYLKDAGKAHFSDRLDILASLIKYNAKNDALSNHNHIGFNANHSAAYMCARNILCSECHEDCWVGKLHRASDDNPPRVRFIKDEKADRLVEKVRRQAPVDLTCMRCGGGFYEESVNGNVCPFCGAKFNEY